VTRSNTLVSDFLHDAPDDARHAAFARAVGIAAVLVGASATAFYQYAGLALSHYDAKAHLVVARRVIDSITPGWQQVGAVWLPLPHLLNLLPVQVDAWYRTGASGIAISVLAFALGAFAAARLVLQATGSRVAAAAAAAVFTLNPDMLYLQATPMTEPLLLGLTLLAVSLVVDWVRQPSRVTRRAAGWALVAACLTRYEAWPVTAAALVLAAAVFLRQRRSGTEAFRLVAQVAAYPALAFVAFLIHSRVTIGEWVVLGGFFVPDNQDQGRPLHAIASVWWGAHHVIAYAALVVAVGGMLGALAIGLRRTSRAHVLVLLSLAASAALPWYAFFHGHPFRIRYMVPLIAAVAVGTGLAVACTPKRVRAVAAAVIVAIAVVQTPPFSFRSPMVLEAQWDRPNSLGRAAVTKVLAGAYRGEIVMASMGSLAHYMQELSAAGFDLADFLHEGNGDIWLEALNGPRPHVGWILIEELAEGGDMLAARSRENPGFLDGFERVAEGGGVALYRRK
jgi:hypothetical protein